MIQVRKYLTVEDVNGVAIEAFFSVGDAVIFGLGANGHVARGVINRIDDHGVELWTESGARYHWLNTIDWIKEDTGGQ